MKRIISHFVDFLMQISLVADLFKDVYALLLEVLKISSGFRLWDGIRLTGCRVVGETKVNSFEIDVNKVILSI